MNIELNICIPQVKIIAYKNIVIGAKMVLLFPAFIFEQESASTQSSFRRQGHCTRLAPHK